MTSQQNILRKLLKDQKEIYLFLTGCREDI